MSEVMTDADYIRAQLRRLNPEFHESDYAWHALKNLESTIQSLTEERDTLRAALAGAIDLALDLGAPRRSVLDLQSTLHSTTGDREP